MHPPDPHPPEPSAPSPSVQDLPGATRSMHGEVSRTWELELLISGAVVWALLQLPAEAEGVYRRMDPHLARLGGTLLLMGYLYVKAILYALITCFLLHLAARAYWVGLIGLDSVFPKGVRWSELRTGPYVERAYRERLPSLPALIVRIDNFCSAIFSFAFLIVLLFGFSVAGTVLGLGVSTVLSAARGGGSRAFLAATVVIGLLLAVPSLALSLVDRRLGERIDPASRAGRLMARLAALNYRTSLVGVFGPIMLTLFSNVRKRVMYPLFYAIFGGLLLVVFVELFVRNDLMTFSGLAYVPAEAPGREVSPAFYEDQRDPEKLYRRMPSIQSDVVRGPYVKLFVPYSPERHDAALARCPGARRFQEQGFRLGRADGAADSAAVEAVLRCMARIHAATLNGRPVADLRLDFATHPVTGVRGVVAFLPTAGLPRGRNVLTVGAVPSPERRRNAKPLTPWVIPFWI